MTRRICRRLGSAVGFRDRSIFIPRLKENGETTGVACIAVTQGSYAGVIISVRAQHPGRTIIISLFLSTFLPVFFSLARQQPSLHDPWGSTVVYYMKQAPRYSAPGLTFLRNSASSTISVSSYLFAFPSPFPVLEA